MSYFFAGPYISVRYNTARRDGTAAQSIRICIAGHLLEHGMVVEATATQMAVAASRSALVQLCCVEGDDRIFEKPPAAAETAGCLATANHAVPLLWLGLFGYEEAQVRMFGATEVFAAVAPLAQAQARALRLTEVLPRSMHSLVGAARVLSQQLATYSSGYLVLAPAELMSTMERRTARAYLKQLFNLTDLWAAARDGVPWSELIHDLRQISPDLDRVLEQPDERRVRYYLIGSLAEHSELEAFLLSEGQAEGDGEVEALAVGEQGLLLGRYAGRWKLMCSGCDEDLLGVWGIGDMAYIVGRRGTVLQLRNGRCTRLDVPTTHTLHAVWGLAADSVCAVGERGTVLAYNGQRWQIWPVPTHAALHGIWGDKLDNLYLAGQDTAVLRYDGYAWSRMPLPVEGFVTQLSGRDGVPVAVGGSRRGGEAFFLQRGAWVADERLQQVEWLEGLWLGWEAELGVVPRTGPALRLGAEGWKPELLPTRGVSAVAAGTRPMVAGTHGQHQVIASLGEQGWDVDMAWAGLKVCGLWVAGRARPPRLSCGKSRQGAGTEGGASAAAGGGALG